MTKKGLLLITILIALTIGIYSLGYTVAYNSLEKKSLNRVYDVHTFYGQIQNMQNNYLLISGLSVNSRDFQGRYIINIADATKFLADNKTISKDKLQIGNNVAITYIGLFRHKALSEVSDVIAVEVLNDETTANMVVRDLMASKNTDNSFIATADETKTIKNILSKYKKFTTNDEVKAEYELSLLNTSEYVYGLSIDDGIVYLFKDNKSVKMSTSDSKKIIKIINNYNEAN